MFTEVGTVVRRAFVPAANLIGRLKYWQKFVLIGFVLIAPLAYVVFSYLGVQNRDTAFAAKERVGVVYVKPATDLLSQVVSARALAVQVAARQADVSALAGASSQINAAIARVDAVHGAGAALALNGQWATLKRQIQTVTAAPVTTPAKALADYDGLTSGIESLIAADGNNSNMILDPDNDSYYVMDAVLNRLPVLMDSAGQAGDLQTVIAASGKATLAKRLTLEDLKGTILTQLSNSDPDYASALHNTHDAAMKGLLTRPLASFDGSLNAVTTQLSSAVQGTLDGASAGRLGATTRSTAMALTAASLPVIDHLLAVRVGGFNSAATQTELIALIAVLIALYLFVGFYLSVRRSQEAILDGLQGLQDNCTDPLADGLDAMATGDLTRHIDADTPVVAQTTRDELGSVVIAVNAIRERVISSITSFNSMVDQLRSMIGNVSTSAGAISAASQQMSSTSEEAGRATGEIAHAVGDVAQGAERQVTMIDDARHTGRRGGPGRGRIRQHRAAGRRGRSRDPSGRRRRRRRGRGRERRDAIGTGILDRGHRRDRRTRREVRADRRDRGNDHRDRRADQPARPERRDRSRPRRGAGPRVRGRGRGGPKAGRRIPALIGTIQIETTKTVDVVQDGARRTEEGAVVVEQTREAFERIGSSVDDMTARIEQIAAASQQIAASATKVQDSITEIAAVAEQSSASTEEVSASTEQTSASTEQIAASAHELANTAQTLEQLVAKFHLTS